MAQGVFLGWKNNPKGYRYGFIKPDDATGDDREQNLYVKDDDVVGDPNTLAPRCRVEFEERDLEGRRQAANVEPIGDLSSPSVTVSQERFRGIVKFFNDKTKFGFIDGDGGEIHVGGQGYTAAHGAPLRGGDVVEYSVGVGERGRTAQNVVRVGFESGTIHGDPFNDLFELPNPNWKQALAALADDEPWEYRLTKSHAELPILTSFISHTFRRLLEMDGGIVESKDAALLAFNTGLVTENQEEIFGLARRLQQPGYRPWSLNRWVKKSERDFISHFGDRIPPLAEFFEDPSELIFDRRIELHINIDHVLARLDRFPPELRDNEYTARQLLVAAEAETKKRAYRNYKVAIPQFFRDQGGSGRLQLLLPICLTTPKKADLALTVEKNAEKTAYLSSTVLTLDQAYNNARLLARPDREWLEP